MGAGYGRCVIRTLTGATEYVGWCAMTSLGEGIRTLTGATEYVGWWAVTSCGEGRPRTVCCLPTMVSRVAGVGVAGVAGAVVVVVAGAVVVEAAGAVAVEEAFSGVKGVLEMMSLSRLGMRRASSAAISSSLATMVASTPVGVAPSASSDDIRYRHESPHPL